MKLFKLQQEDDGTLCATLDCFDEAGARVSHEDLDADKFASLAADCFPDKEPEPELTEENLEADGTDTDGDGTVELTELSKAELQEKAEALEVPSYKSMNKDELIAAIEEAEAQG